VRYAYTTAALAAVVLLAADRQRLAARLRDAWRDAHHDPATGLLNRRGLAERAPAVLARSAPGDRRRPVVVVACDLVGFKQVNDRYGHDAGDAVLVAVADRLAAAQGVVAAARRGGDEYAAIVRTDPGTDLAIVLAGLHAAVTGLVVWQGTAVPVGATLGAVAANSGRPLGTWLARADAAMYRARARRHSTAVWRAGRDPDPVPARQPVRPRDRRPASPGIALAA
jgi:diguanylate cyclase (GGDEF)-like protein